MASEKPMGVAKREHHRNKLEKSSSILFFIKFFVGGLEFFKPPMT
jgi:hypothetical protein